MLRTVSQVEMAILLTIKKAGRPLSPKEIGLEIGYGENASRNVSAGLRRLRAVGILTRTKVTTRDASYALTEPDRMNGIRIAIGKQGRRPDPKLGVYIAKLKNKV